MTFLASRIAQVKRLPGWWPLCALLPVCGLIPAFALSLANQRDATEVAAVQSYLLTDIPLMQGPQFTTSSSDKVVLPAGLEAAGELTLADSDRAAEFLSSARQPISNMSPAQDETGVTVNGRRLLNVNYDLAVRGARSGDLEVNKRVNLNGRPAGVLNVSIDQNSQLYVSSTDLSQLLPQELYSRLGADGGYVAFDTLRTSGIDISYDPVRDTLAINL